MTFSHLFESPNVNVLAVDLQPAYFNIQGIREDQMQDIVQFCENQRKRIVALYNGGDYSDDWVEDVQEFWMNFGASEDLVHGQIEWIEKGYAFFRGWMDTGIPDKIILRTIRKMIEVGAYDSRELTAEDMQDAIGKELLIKLSRENDGIKTLVDNPDDWDSIHLPEFAPQLYDDAPDWITPTGLIKFLRDLSPFYMIGGARDMCLREIELLCNAYNIRYRRIDSLIYN